MRRARAATLVLLAMSLVLSACGGGDDDASTSTSTSTSTSASPSTTSTMSSSTTSTTTSGSPSSTSSPLPAGFALSEQRSPTFPGQGGDLGVGRAVRVGAHDTYDRVVYEFTGSGVPAYAVRYVDQPIADPSGKRVTVAGDAYLEVYVAALGYGDGAGSAPSPVSSSALAGTVIADSGVLTFGFEGIGQTFVGVRDRERPFRVTTLTAPSRLVIDVLR